MTTTTVPEARTNARPNHRSSTGRIPARPRRPITPGKAAGPPLPLPLSTRAPPGSAPRRDLRRPVADHADPFGPVGPPKSP